MALGAGDAWRLEDDGDPRREALRLDNLRAAYETERAGYLLKAENAEEEAPRERWLKRAAGVETAAAKDGVPLAPVKQPARR